jgi:phosphodiesterase/alkaline phosphatase D-like protein
LQPDAGAGAHARLTAAESEAQMVDGVKIRREVARCAGAVALAIAVLAAGISPASQALAASAPSATTGSAAQIGFASATVGGTVNPAGSATSYYFQYGPTSAYGYQTSAASAGAGSSNVAVEQSLSGLSASTTYHYRLVGDSAGGTVYGNDATFSTTATPSPTVTTGAATSVGFASATLAGTVNLQGVPTTYYFQYGTTLAYGSKTAVGSAGSASAAQNVTATLGGLSASTTYHYRLVADSAGGTVVGPDATLTTAKTPAPAAVTGAATSVTTTTATLNGTVNPAGVATNYYFQYGTSSGYGHTTATHSAGAGTTAAALSAAVSGLAAGQTYHFRVVAVSAGGTVDGRDGTLATAKVPTPTVATGTATAVSTTTATLTGTVDPHGASASYYFLYGTRSPTIRTPTQSAGAGSAGVAASAVLAGLAPGTSYAYRLVAVGAVTVDGSIHHFTTAKVPAALSLSSSPDPVLAGASVTLSGTLTGTGVGIRTVALEVEPYPYRSGFTIAGAGRATSATGAFSFTLAGLKVNTMVRVVTVSGSPALASPVTVERVLVRVGVRVQRHGRAVRFNGAVAPSGTPVRIEIQRRFRGHWITIVRMSAYRGKGGASVYARTIRHPQAGRYRIVALARSGGLLPGRSRVVTLG